MADKTKIEWTDATWNPVTGCSVVSPGCTNCYAMKLAGTRLAHIPSRAGLTRDSKAGPVWTGEVRLNQDMLTHPLKWRKPRMIFVCAHGDLFHESVPDEWIDKVFAVMALAPQHTFQVLTKRADRMRSYMATRSGIWWTYIPNRDHSEKIVPADEIRAQVTAWLATPSWREKHPATASIAPRGKICAAITWPLPNVWLGVSVEDQARANERIPDLLATPAGVRFLSCEPLLGPVDLETAWCGDSALDSECWGECGWCEQGKQPLYNCQRHEQSEAESMKGRSGLDWVICGGESGPGARPMHPDWARDLRDQCRSSGVSFFMKQMWGQTKRSMPAIPDDLLIREFPNA